MGLYDYSLSGATLGNANGGLAASFAPNTATAPPPQAESTKKGLDPAKKQMAAQMLMGGLKDLGQAGFQQINVAPAQFRDR